MRARCSGERSLAFSFARSCPLLVRGSRASSALTRDDLQIAAR